MKTSTFTQVVGSESLIVTIPENRVSTIIDRVDRYIEKGKIEAAKEVLLPFVGATPAELKKTQPVSKRSSKNEQVEAIIEEYRERGRYSVIQALTEKLGLPKGNAYYLTRKYKVQ